MSIFEDKRYKDSMAALTDDIHNHKKVLETLYNETEGDDGSHTMVFGWVLAIGEMGTDSDGEEFNSAMVEFPTEQNMFTSIGLADHALRELRSRTESFRDED